MSTATATADRVIPGPKGWAKWRALRQFSTRPHEFYLELATTYGGIIFLDYPLEKVVLLAHPEYIEHVLHHNHRNYVKQTGRWRSLRQIWGNGLAMSDGDFWRRQRQRIQPAFHQECLDHHFGLFVEEAEATAAQWAEAADRQQPRDVYRDCLDAALHALTRAMFGSDVSSRTDAIRAALAGIHSYVNPVSLMSLLDPPLFVRRWLTPGHRRFEAAMQTLNSEFDQLLRRRRAGKTQGADLLALFMAGRDDELSETMTHQQLHDEMMVMLMAGHETTGVALGWTWHFLSESPEVERRLHDEVEGVLGGRLPTLADLPRLTYTRMVIEEVLRIHPPIYAFDRQAVDDDVIDGYRIPARATVAISSYAMQHHPKYWDRPDAFDPQRHDPAQPVTRPDYTFFPFGGGPRRCVGFRFALMQMTALLATLASRFRVERTPGYRVVPMLRLNFAPSPGVPMLIRRRV